MTEHNYRITTYRYLDESEIYWVANAAEFPAAVGIGSTRDAALADLDSAITAAKEHLQEMNLPIPGEFLYDPDEASGRFTARLPKSLHRALIQEAEEEGLSLNQYLLYLLARRHETTPPIARTKPEAMQSSAATSDSLSLYDAFLL